MSSFPLATLKQHISWTIFYRNSNSMDISFCFHYSDCYEILYRAVQLCCCGMCKILQQYYHLKWSYTKTNFPLNLNYNWKISMEIFLWSAGRPDSLGFAYTIFCMWRLVYIPNFFGKIYVGLFLLTATTHRPSPHKVVNYFCCQAELGNMTATPLHPSLSCTVHSLQYLSLTHRGRDKMAALSQTTLASAFSWMKMFEFWFRFHWSLLPRVELTIFQHWFR